MTRLACPRNSMKNGMRAGGEADGVNIQSISSHLSISDEKKCKDQWQVEGPHHTKTFRVELVDDSDKKESPKDAMSFSPFELKNTKLAEENKSHTLSSHLQEGSSSSNSAYQAREKDSPSQNLMQLYPSDSISSEHRNSSSRQSCFDVHAMKEEVDSNIYPCGFFPCSNQNERVKSSQEFSSSRNRSLKLREASQDIRMVDIQHSLEFKEATNRTSEATTELDLIHPQFKDESRYRRNTLDCGDGCCASKQFISDTTGTQLRSPAFPGNIEGTSTTNSDFTRQSGNISAMPRWRKVLYERQPFEDNYVDPLQFLQDLRQNKNLKTYEYTEVVKNTFVIVQQISIVVLFLCAFSMLLDETTTHYILYVDLALFLSGFIVYLQLQFVEAENASMQDYVPIHLSQIPNTSGPGRSSKNPRTNLRYSNDLNRGYSRPGNGFSIVKHRGFNLKRESSVSTNHNGNTILHSENKHVEPESLYRNSAFDFFRKTIGLGTLLVLLTPILSTLTVSYSNDTIVALSIFTMSLHVLTANYNYLNAYTTDFSPNLSVNAASFGVIMMASRIPNPLDSGALIAFGSFCFSLSPVVRHIVKRTSFTAHVALTFLLFGIGTGCLLTIPILAILYVTCVLMISFVIPWWFVLLHSSVKNQINGPWDEAKPTNSAAAAEWANTGLLS